MNDIDRGKVVGMVLGDGHIRTATAKDKTAGRHIAAQLTFAHSSDQREYANYKVDVLNGIFGGQATLREGEYQGYRRCYAAKSNPYFKTLKGMMYVNGKKTVTRRVLDMLTPEGIAFWFMDDGSYTYHRNEDGRISSVTLNIATCVSENEINDIVDYFSEKHGIVAKKALHKRTQLWCLRFNTKESREFEKIIRPFIHPSMYYKIATPSERHESPRPDLVCISCGKIVKRLCGGKRCNACYLRDWYAHKRAMR